MNRRKQGREERISRQKSSTDMLAETDGWMSDAVAPQDWIQALAQPLQEEAQRLAGQIMPDMTFAQLLKPEQEEWAQRITEMIDPIRPFQELMEKLPAQQR